jgi:hypothetical protein
VEIIKKTDANVKLFWGNWERLDGAGFFVETAADFRKLLVTKR